MSHTGYVLRQFTDRLDPGAAPRSHLSGAHRVLYCHRGSVTLSDGTALSEDEALYRREPVGLTAGEAGAVLWRFELSRADAEPQLLDGERASSQLMVSEELAEPDPSGTWILRCDSVKFPMGGTAFKHVHQGPGIRVLREGQIEIETGGHKQVYLPGQAWFEPGPEPVVAVASELECTRFIRVMVLPEELLGKSSIQYVNPEDLDKPKSQRYKGYVDEPIDH